MPWKPCSLNTKATKDFPNIENIKFVSLSLSTDRDSLIHLFSSGHSRSPHSLCREGIPFKLMDTSNYESSPKSLASAATVIVML